MGLTDYYRQFEGLSEEEVNRGLREEAAERRRKALTQVVTLDLSQTTWPELPHVDVVNAITFIARAGLHSYPHMRGSKLRRELARRHGVEPGRLIVGNGAAQLLSSATRALIEPGQELITRWPSYPLYPIMARRAHGRAVRVNGNGGNGEGGGSSEGGGRGKVEVGGKGEGSGDLVDRLLHAAAEHNTRVVVLASPNDPTGELVASAELERLLAGLPEGVAVLLDESLVEFADAQPTDSSLALLDRYPHLLVFRSFSKAHGLAGLRLGYAIGGPGSEELLTELEPDLGVSEVSQAGALEELHSGAALMASRVKRVCEERVYLTAELRQRNFEVTDSQANFLWVAHPDTDGNELSTRLGRTGVLVAAGAALGEPRHARISLLDRHASTRLLGAIDNVLRQPAESA